MSEAPTIDSLMTEIAESGWLFNNCYQMDDSSWRVNLRRPDGKGDWFTDWATGDSIIEAVESCLLKMIGAEYKEEQPVVHSIDKTATKDARSDGQSLLAKLGLLKKEQPFERRSI